MRRCKCKETLLIRIDKKEKQQKKGARNKKSERNQTLSKRRFSRETDDTSVGELGESIYLYVSGRSHKPTTERKSQCLFSKEAKEKKK
jgi:hypothetical protein